MPTNHSIPTKEADELIKRFLRIQEELTKEGALKNFSADVQQYFADKFVSFVFYKDQLDALFKDLKDEANAVRVYYGAHEKGFSTMVITPCKLNPDNEYEVRNIVPPNGPIQYPPPKKTALVADKFQLPLDNYPSKG